MRSVLDKIIENKEKNGEISLRSLTSGGANYTSSLISATVTLKNGGDLKLFAKVANINEKLRKATNVKFMFEVEQFVYTEIVETYERIQDRHNVPLECRFVFPKFYGGDVTDGKETVVLEDLVSKGYSSFSRFQSTDWDHIKCAVKIIARFHALSFAFAKEDPDNFAKALEKVKLQLSTNRDNPEMKELWFRMMGAAVQVAKEEHKEKIKEFLCRELPPEEVYRNRMPISTPVLCHGDYRISNLLFKEEDDHIETIVVDYQTVHAGCPVMDLLYLEFMGTDEKFRRQYHEKMLDEYFTELTLALDRLDVDVNDVYPRETFDSELKQMLPIALRTASFILPLVLVEPDLAPQLGKASVGDFAISPNQLFAERFSGLISDCVRWGAL